MISFSGMQSEEIQRILQDLEVLKCLNKHSPHTLRVEDTVLDEQQMRVHVFSIYINGKKGDMWHQKI
jgi:hypothetical protein